MRTIAAKHPKGHEPRRTILDNLRLIRYIASAGFTYFVTGRRIRNVWYERQRRREKYFVDDEHP